MTVDATARPVRLVGALLRRDGKVLLGLRATHRRSCPDCWDVIGGHVESGESLSDALARELTEEIGIVPVTMRALPWFEIDDPADGRVPLHVFLVDDWEGEPSIVNDEHVELRWFATSEARQLSNLAVKGYRALFDALA